MTRLFYVLCVFPLLALACGQTVPVSDYSELSTGKTTILTTPTVKITLPKSTQKPVEQKNGVVCSSGGLNVREGAGTAFSSVSVLVDGARVVLTGVTKTATDGGVWVQIRSPLGWVNSNYICEEIKQP